ncbi:MAG TPA: sulfate adenylyltransferase [Bdellovibrionota bacterium]|nr:sulfate adenylyltransferase [Bdellovibrionota bacterium]
MLTEPHGGQLIECLVSSAELSEFEKEAKTLPKLTLDNRELADLELIAVGAVSPLQGFMGSADYLNVLDRLRLSNGTVWPLPITIAINDIQRKELSVGKKAALYDSTDRLWGVLQIEEIFERDPKHEAKAIYRTEDPSHPGVAYLLSRPTLLIGGKVKVLPLPSNLSFSEYRLTPKALREKIAQRKWQRVAGFQTRNPIHRAHEHLTKLALEFTDGLVIHPLIGETKSDDIPASVRFQAYQILIENYYPKDRTLLAAFPAAMRYAGPREAIFHALVRKNYGITHFIVGRDHAGVGKFYGPLEAQEIFDRFEPSELGVVALKFDPTFYCKACGNLASERTCPHGDSERLEFSGTKVRDILRSGGNLPQEFTRPEVAKVLRDYYAADTKSENRTNAPTISTNSPGGFILWFTGMSGAGKSTIANVIKRQLSNRRLEILDGDEVRTYLSKGLGFSKEDRDANIRRIGFVARLLARNGVIAITAAISPYKEIRNEVRKLAAQDGVPFVEVFVKAELNTLINRDVKGLYKKAIAGEIKNFTGVSDPYEPPDNPEVLVRTDTENVGESAKKILGFLDQAKLIKQ